MARRSQEQKSGTREWLSPWASQPVFFQCRERAFRLRNCGVGDPIGEGGNPITIPPRARCEDGMLLGCRSSLPGSAPGGFEVSAGSERNPKGRDRMRGQGRSHEKKHYRAWAEAEEHLDGKPAIERRRREVFNKLLLFILNNLLSFVGRDPPFARRHCLRCFQ